MPCIGCWLAGPHPTLRCSNLSLSVSCPQKHVFELEQDASDDYRTDPKLLHKCKAEIARLCSDQPKHGGEVQVGAWMGGLVGQGWSGAGVTGQQG